MATSTLSFHQFQIQCVHVEPSIEIVALYLSLSNTHTRTYNLCMFTSSDLCQFAELVIIHVAVASVLWHFSFAKFLPKRNIVRWVWRGLMKAVFHLQVVINLIVYCSLLLPVRCYYPAAISRQRQCLQLLFILLSNDFSLFLAPLCPRMNNDMKFIVCILTTLMHELAHLSPFERTPCK